MKKRVVSPRNDFYFNTREYPTCPDFIKEAMLELYLLRSEMVREGNAEAKAVLQQGWGRRRGGGDQRLYEARDKAKATWEEVTKALQAAGWLKTVLAYIDNYDKREHQRLKLWGELDYDVHGDFFQLLEDISGILYSPGRKPTTQDNIDLLRGLLSSVQSIAYRVDLTRLKKLHDLLSPLQRRCEKCQDTYRDNKSYRELSLWEGKLLCTWCIREEKEREECDTTSSSTSSSGVLPERTSSGSSPSAANEKSTRSTPSDPASNDTTQD